jgi:antirestriction protein ArdC
MDYSEIMKAELIAHNIILCACAKPHNRAFAVPDKREIHFSKKGATRSTLATFLHEIGHVVKNHGKTTKLRRFQREQEAEDYAVDSFRCYDIPYPRKRGRKIRRYVSQWKRIGDKIKQSRRGK